MKLQVAVKTIRKKVVTLLLLGFVVNLLYFTLDGLYDKGSNADITLVLGSKVNAEGTCSTRLQKRLDKSLSLYQQGRVKKILVSGGLGKEGFYEGDKMKAYLITKGVTDSVIIVDNKGDNTLASVDNALAIKDSLHLNSIIAVSQYFHLTRTKMFFRKRKFSQISTASPLYFEIRDFYSLPREVFAFYVYLCK